MIIKNIIKGWYRWFFKKKHPVWAVDRLDICEKCLHNQNDFCMICGCFIPAKVLVEDEQCHLNKWPKNDNDYGNK